MRIKSTRAVNNMIHRYSRDAWALFRDAMRRAPHKLIWGHLSEFESASHERSPPG